MYFKLKTYSFYSTAGIGYVYNVLSIILDLKLGGNTFKLNSCFYPTTILKNGLLYQCIC